MHYEVGLRIIFFLIMLSVRALRNTITLRGSQQLLSSFTNRHFAVESSTKPLSFLKNFISNIIEDDLSKHKNGGRVVTRFPPEPNGYLHLGHAKSISFNFGVARHFGGVTHMRFDDTNPSKEDMEYVRSILDDVSWLVTGETKCQPPPWFGEIRHASDYFPVIYNAAEYLIQNNLAYVDDSSSGRWINIKH